MTESPSTIRPGVAAVVRDEGGRILLHRRKVGDGWAPPSGSVEPGERLETALLREIREETALTVEVGRLVGVYSDPAWQVVRYPGGRLVHFVTCVFACRKSEGRLQGSDEGTSWKWFRPEEFPDDLLTYARMWLADAQGDDPLPVVR